MTQTTEKVVIFRLADDHFAADVSAVERVLKHQPPRAVPNVPAWILGVIDYQQRVVPVVDLRRRFELPDAAASDHARILILGSGGEWIGVVVDAVTEVAAIGAADLQPPPKYFRGLAGEYLRGLVRRDDRIIIVLDPERLLSATERIVLERVVAESSGADR
ncbi:MAG TPA: chemotaxis protein CheW [Gemmatimonadaceae bacterium]|nr:chemotaxis protein CheW [Gemmatimonadaceae bacterium]